MPPPKNVKSGSRRLLDPMPVINEFIIEATKRLHGEEIRVQEIRKSQEQLAETTGYSFQFRGVAVVIHTDDGRLFIDGTSVGEDVDGTLFDRLKDACAERSVMQSADDTATERARVQEEARKVRRESYAPLARKLRQRLIGELKPLVKKR